MANPFSDFVERQTILDPLDPGPQNQEFVPKRKPEPPTAEPPPTSPSLLVFPGAVDAIIQQESGGDPNAVSTAGAQGLMQLMPGTAAELGVTDSFDPVQNRDGGTRYLQQQLDAYQDWELALMAYNWGPGNVQRWLSAGAKSADVPKETRGYVGNILPQIEQMIQDSTVANPASLMKVSETSADEASEVQKLAAELTMPTAVVARNLPEVKRISAANKFAAFAPVTVKTLAEDPDFMAIAHDDAENMSAFEKKAGDMSFGTAFGRGIDLLQSLGGRFVEASGELFGAEEVAAFGREAAERNEREAEAGGPRSKFVDISSAGDFVQWLTETVGEQIPLMSGPLAGAAAGGALGALGGPAAPVTIPLGAILGAFIPSLILGVGETQAAIKERDPDVEAPGVAFGAGAVIAALDSALPGKLGTRLVKAFGVNIAGEVVKRIGIETAKRAVKGATLEGITEGIQTVVSEAAAAVATDTAIDPKALADEIIESVAAGFFLGFGTTTIAETGGTAVQKYRNANNNKRQADKLNELAVESKVKERDPAKRNAFEVKVLLGAGFEAVGVKAVAILDWAQNHADGPDAALASLGTDAETVFAAEIADTDIAVTAAQLAEHFIGNEQAYETIANDLRMTDGQETVSEAVAPLVEVAPDIKKALAELEEIAPNLGERMAELVTVLEGGDTVKVAEALDKAPQNVRAKLDELVAQVTEERVTVEEEEIRGRFDELDRVISDLDVKIEAANVAIDEAEEAGRSHKTLDKRLDKLEQRRKKAGDEQAGLPQPHGETILGATSDVLIPAVPAEIQAENEALNQEIADLQRQKADEDIALERAKEGLPSPAAKILVGRVKKRRTSLNKQIALAEEKLAANEKKFAPKPPARERGLSLKAKALDALEIKTTRAAVRALRKGFRAGRALTEENFKILQDQALAAVKESPLKGTQREAVLTQIAKVQTVERLEKLKTSILNRVEKQRQRELLTAITKTLEKVVKVKGKLTPTVQTIVDSLSETMKLSEEEAAAALDLREGGIEQVPGVQGKLENMILAALGRPDTRNSAELENLLLELHNLISDAKAIRTAGELIRAMEADNLRADTLAALGEERDVPRGDRAQKLLDVEVVGLAMNGAWATKLRRIFASDDQAFVEGVLEKLSLFTEARVFEQNKIDSTKRLVELLQQRFPGLSESKLFKQMYNSQTETVEVGEFTHAAFGDEVGQSKKIVMKRSELRQRVMEMRNEKLNTLARHPKGNAYTDEIIQALEDALTEDDVLMIDAQQEFYNEFYQRINAVYERIYGYSLPQVENYVPIRREFTDEKNDEFLNNIHFMNNINPSAIKTRQDSVRPLLAAHDVGRLQSHMMQMEYFIAFAEKVRLLNDVFAGDRAEVSGRIRANFGAKMLGTIKKDLEYFANRGILSSITGEDMWVRLLRNYSFAQLGISPQIGFKQLVSSTAYVENVKTTDFMAGVTKFLRNPKKALRFLNKNSQFFRNRGMNLDQDFADMVRDSNSFLGKRPTLTKWIMAPIRWGDRTAIAIGGFAHIQAAMKAGKTEEQAIRSFERISVDTQQSQDPDQVSELQRSNALMRVMAQFMSSANALARAEYTAVVEAKAGRISKQELAKRIIVLHFVIPSMIQYIANAFHWEDDDQLRAVFLGAFNGLFIIGDLAEYAVGWAVGNENVFDLEIRHPLEFFTDIFKAIDAYGEDDIGIEGFFEGIRSLDLALRVGAAKTGLPFNKFYNEVRGFADFVTGDPAEGGALMLGYSPWIIDKFDIGN